MGIAVDGFSSYLDTVAANEKAGASANRTTGALSGLSSESSEEDLVEAAESFEAYMVEQVLKQLKESVMPEEDKDSVMGQYKDLYMDSTIQEIAKTMVSQYGSTMTEDLVEQMKLNYGIE